MFDRLKKRIENYFYRLFVSAIKSEVPKIVDSIIESESFNVKRRLQVLANISTSVFIQKNIPLHKVFVDRFALLNEAIALSDKEGLYLEFGVFQGSTIRFIANQLKQTRIYGFDSFKGLREEWLFSSKGQFDLDSIYPEVPENVELIDGYFEDTLPIYVNNKLKNISFIHVDCDLYSSTKTVFNNLAKFFKEGTIIVFDEFFNYPNWEEGEFLAWNEFVVKYNVHFEYIGYTFQKTDLYKSGQQVAIRILSIEK